jgi:hypothetical protein
LHDNTSHRSQVDEWMARATKGPPERLLEAFEQSFGALWRRARLTLGDVTLMAILDRVLYTTAERFPQLPPLEVDETGLRAEKLRDSAGSLRRDHLAEAIRFILVEFLTVLGKLTAEVLSPALHAELSKVAPGAKSPARKQKS